jgi:ATP-binding cassette subfamily F protein 3
LYEGNYDDYLDQKQATYDRQVQAYTTQQKYLEHQQKFINRFRYKASKASAVQSRIKLLDKLEKVDLPENDAHVSPIALRFTDRLPNLLMELKDLQVGFQPQGQMLVEVG